MQCSCLLDSPINRSEHSGKQGGVCSFGLRLIDLLCFAHSPKILRRGSIPVARSSCHHYWAEVPEIGFCFKCLTTLALLNFFRKASLRRNKNIGDHSLPNSKSHIQLDRVWIYKGIKLGCPEEDRGLRVSLKDSRVSPWCCAKLSGSSICLTTQSFRC